MATILNFKPIIDKPEWRPVSVAQSGLTPNGTNSVPLLNSGTIASDLRSNNYNTPKLWAIGISGHTTHIEYNSVTDGWSGIYNAGWGTGGSGGTGSIGAVAPSQGPKGALLAGNTSSILNLDTTYYAPVAATWTRSGTTITVTTSREHWFTSNQKLAVSVSSDITAVPISSFTGAYNITFTGFYTFTIVGNNAGATSGTLTIGIPIMADQWADRGDGLGFIIRVVGLTSGKTEERRIVSNTGFSGSTGLYTSAPTIYLDQPLSFTPSLGDRFELLSGKIFAGATGTSVAGQWRSYDIAALRNSDNLYAQSGNMSVTNLILGAAAQGGIVVLDEQHVPANRIPGEGFIIGSATYDTATLTGTNYINTKGCLLATASAVSSITGQATNGDSIVVANEYRNFQIRIVEDTVNPAANGQRRRISSHTAGPSAVYTVSNNWTNIPSANCKFVIENWTDNILVTSGASPTMFTYKVSNLCLDGAQSYDSWSTTQFTSTNGPTQNGILVHGFGTKRIISTNTSIRSSYIYSIANGSVYVFDIAGGVNGLWTTTGNQRYLSPYIQSTSTSLISCYSYDPFTGEGDAIYLINSFLAGLQTNLQVFKISLLKGDISGYTPIKSPYGYFSGTGWNNNNPAPQNKMGTICYQDGTTKLTAIYAPMLGRSTTANNNEFYELLITV